MPSYIVKPDMGKDFYVLWSTVVEAPTCWGPRAEMREDWPHLGDHNGPWDETRFDRADQVGSSAQWPTPEKPIYGYDDAGFIYMQRGWLPRGKLREAVERMTTDEHADIGDLMTPFEDAAEVRPQIKPEPTQAGPGESA